MREPATARITPRMRVAYLAVSALGVFAVRSLPLAGAVVLAQSALWLAAGLGPRRLARQALKLWGFAAFVLAYAALQPFGVPGTVFVWAAPLIWPWPVAFALSMTGTMAASVVGFSFARFVARDWVAAKIPARFRRYDEALAQRAFSTVFLLRFVFWMPQVLHTFLGVSGVPFWTHFWGSLAGYVIPLLLVSYFGQRLFDAMRAAPPSVWVGLAAGVACITLATWWLRRRSRLAGVSA